MLSLNAAETGALAYFIDAEAPYPLTLERRDSLDNPYPDGFLIVGLVDGSGAEYAISETGETTVWTPDR